MNRRDPLGRTVLHLLASSDDPAAFDFLTLLLTHPSVNYNLQDHESGWTALHRALYVGHVHVALLLLERTDIDTTIRDWEGLTAFDLYNTTVDGTCPRPEDDLALGGGVLFVWGSNRNYNLGLGHSNDSSTPERLKLPRPVATTAIAGRRFDRPLVRDVSLSRWHTVVATNERRQNVYVCGVGTNGRLGRMPPAQPQLEPLREWDEPVRAVVAAQDHTVLITMQGAVYTFGANRMAQLGYTLEEGLGTTASSSGTIRSQGVSSQGTTISALGTELDIQVSPRRVLGPLKREVVLGAAASRLHTVVFTSDAVYTWGTNNGQLGYDRHSAPVQVQPRRVTSITAPVRQVAATEFATACLLASWDVVVLHGDAYFKITFPMPRVPSEAGLFRARHVPAKPMIRRLTCTGTTFAALTELGDLYTFHMEHPSATGAKVTPPRPQLVWSVRRKFAAVRDVAIGLDGTIVLCTNDGHVYVRERKLDVRAKTRTPKFQLVPYLQRVVRVMANDLGSWAAVQAPTRPASIPVRGPSLADDLLALVPETSVAVPVDDMTASIATMTTAENDDSESDDEASTMLSRYLAHARTILLRASAWPTACLGPLREALPAAYTTTGCDAALCVDRGGCMIPVHRDLLALRIPSLTPFLWQTRPTTTAPVDIVLATAPKTTIVHLPGLSLVSALVLVHYLYTDDLLPVWTAQMHVVLQPLCRSVGVSMERVRPELLACATLLDLAAVRTSLEHGLLRAPPSTMRTQCLHVFERIRPGASLADVPGADALLHLADADVPCHTLFLRRSPMLQALCAWRQDCGEHGPIEIAMPHWSWRVMRLGLAFLYTDAGTSIFDGTDAEVTPDQFMDLVLDVLQLADELLLSKLQLLTLTFLTPRIKPTNVGALLTDAQRLNAPALREVCLTYIAHNLETLLERHCLDLLLPSMRRDVTQHIQTLQEAHTHRSIARDRLFALTLKHQDFVDTLDLPPPSLHTLCLQVAKWEKPARSLPTSHTASAPSHPASAAATDDTMLFAMDDDVSTAGPAAATATATAEPAWHTVGAKTTPRPQRPSSVSPSPVPPPMAMPGTASPSTSYSGPRMMASRSSLEPSPSMMHEARPRTDPPSRRTPTSTSPSSAVSVETQRAMAQMAVAPKLSQKERKRQQQQQQQQQPRTALQEATPVWHRTSRPSPSTSPATAFPALSSTHAAPRSGTTPTTPPVLSFAQIQAQQQWDAQRQQAQQQRPTNFAQILDEERRVQERVQQEREEAEAFERWFEEESRRVQEEARRQQASQRTSQHQRRANPPPRRSGAASSSHQGRRGRRRGKPDPTSARIDDM